MPYDNAAITAAAVIVRTHAHTIWPAMLLKKVMTIKLIAIFFGIVTGCIVFSGYLINLIL